MRGKKQQQQKLSRTSTLVSDTGVLWMFVCKLAIILAICMFAEALVIFLVIMPSGGGTRSSTEASFSTGRYTCSFFLVLRSILGLKHSSSSGTSSKFKFRNITIWKVSNLQKHLLVLTLLFDSTISTQRHHFWQNILCNSGHRQSQICTQKEFGGAEPSRASKLKRHAVAVYFESLFSILWNMLAKFKILSESWCLRSTCF